MPIKESEFINDLNDRVGNVRDDEFDNGEARKAMAEAIRLYSRWLPQIVHDTIVTVAGQQTYSLQIPELINLRDVYWAGNINFDFDPVIGIPTGIFSYYQPVFSRPSAYHGWKQEVKRRREMGGYGYRFVNFDELSLIPTPDKDGIIVSFEYERSHTINTVHHAHKDLLLDLGEWYAKKIIAEKRRKFGSMTRGGSVSANTGRTENMMREAIQARDRAEEVLNYLRMRSDI